MSGFQKIRSRMNESFRNKRFISIGLGRVAAGSMGPWTEGTAVAFVATAHSRCLERIVLPSSLIWAIEEAFVARVERNEGIVFWSRADASLRVDELSGWQVDSGQPVPAEAINRIIEASHRVWAEHKLEKATILPLEAPTPIIELTDHKETSGPGPSAVLFGYGNYAKTVVRGTEATEGGHLQS